MRARTLRAAMIAALTALAVATPAASAATAPSSVGTEFWIGFESNTGDTNINTLYIAGTQATTGTVELPGMGFTKTFSITPGAVTTVVMPAKSSIEAKDGVERRAVHVTAAKPVSVYGLNHMGASSDAFLALPVDVLGTDYLNLGMRSAEVNGYFYGTQFAVVASQDDTTATITPSQTTNGHAAGQPYTVHLDRGDMYQLRNEDDPHGDLTGSAVTADKPVAVFGGSRISDSPDVPYYAGDHHVEQMPPTNAWGKSFLSVPLATRSKGDTFRVLAQQDDTTVTINGVVAGTIDRGQMVERILTSRSEIEADKPVLVAQHSHSSTFDGSTGDPFFMLIPPTEQFLNDYTVTTPATDFPDNWINVVAPASAVGEVRLDGAPIPASSFSPIGSSGFSGAQVHVSVGSHRLQSASPFGIHVYGWNTYDSYGYPGGLSLAPIATVKSVAVTPDDTTPTVGTQDCFTASVTDGSSAVGGVRVDFASTGTNTSSGFDVADDQGHARYCYTGGSAGPDDVTANVGTVGGTTSVTWHDAPTNQPPHAAFGGSPTSPSSGQTLTLDASSSTDDHGITSYTWDYGDGTTGDGVSATHVYDRPGTYTIALTVTDDGGLSDTVTHEVTVANRPPVAAFSSSPQAPKSGDPVAFDGSASKDPDGQVVSHAWDFGDGTSGTGATPSHTFDKPGTYTVTETVTDDSGATDTVSHQVTVENRPPVAAFSSSPDAPKSGDPVAFDGSGSTDPDGHVVSTTWDFGDGTTGAGTAPSHTYDKPGTYTVTETVTDDAGATGTVSHQVTIANRPPVAAFSSSPTAPKSGDPVAFDGSGSKDPDGQVVSYAWDFGDGTSGTGATPSHTYGKAGTYTVTLTVTDDAGGTATVTHTVTVAAKRTGTFVCRATAVRLPLLGEISTANAAAQPCRGETASLLKVPAAPLLGISAPLSVIDADTAQTPAVLTGTEPKAGDAATAEADVAAATVFAGTTVISVRGLESHASATCTTGGGVSLDGRSEVASLVVNGQVIRTSDLGVRSLDVPLLVATLHINSTVRSGGRVIQRAVWLESPLTGDVVLGEAIAGTSGGVCG